MKKHFLTLTALFLISAPAHSTLVNWTGTIDGSQETASGSYEYSGDLLWSMDLNVGTKHYIYTPQFFSFGPNGPYALSDVPLLNEDQTEGGDLQWNPARWWFGTHEEDMVGQGSVLSFFTRDDGCSD